MEQKEKWSFDLFIIIQCLWRELMNQLCTSLSLPHTDTVYSLLPHFCSSFHNLSRLTNWKMKLSKNILYSWVWNRIYHFFSLSVHSSIPPNHIVIIIKLYIKYSNSEIMNVKTLNQMLSISVFQCCSYRFIRIRDGHVSLCVCVEWIKVMK